MSQKLKVLRRMSNKALKNNDGAEYLMVSYLILKHLKQADLIKVDIMDEVIFDEFKLKLENILEYKYIN